MERSTNKTCRNLNLSIVLGIAVLIGVSCAVAVFNDKSNSIIASDKFERTFIMLKTDAIQRGLIGKIIQRFEAKGFKLVAIKFIWPTKELIENHYGSLVDRDFYARLVKQMTQGPVVPMVWEGLNAVQIGRRMLGPSETVESAPGTIRGDFSIDIERTIIHGAHSVEAANLEINLWFNKSELVSWTPANVNWIYE